MNRFAPHFYKTAGAVAVVTALLAPASASAGQSYIVTVAPPADSSCAATIQAVTTAYSLVPQHSYTSAFCGFSASIPKRTVEPLRADPRVTSVQPDGSTSSF